MEELFYLFVLWCAINTVLIFFLFARLSKIDKLEKELKKINTKFTEIVGATINSTKELLFDRTTQSIMIKLKKENFLFPFDTYEFCSNKFGEISKLLQDIDDTFRENYTNIPERYLIMKEFVLPYFRDNWNEERFTEEFANFIKRHNLQEKTREK